MHINEAGGFMSSYYIGMQLDELFLTVVLHSRLARRTWTGSSNLIVNEYDFSTSAFNPAQLSHFAPW